MDCYFIRLTRADLGARAILLRADKISAFGPLTGAAAQSGSTWVLIDGATFDVTETVVEVVEKLRKVSAP